MMLLLLSGLSVEEAIALRGSDVDLVQSVIRVQGIRFADLQRIVGTLSAPVLGAYAKLSPTGPPAAWESIDRVLLSARSPA